MHRIPAWITVLLVAAAVALVPLPAGAAGRWLAPKLVCFFSQALNAASSSTTTFPCMAEWPTPHSCAHIASKLPACVGVNQNQLTWPGTMFMRARNCGTK